MSTLRPLSGLFLTLSLATSAAAAGEPVFSLPDTVVTPTRRPAPVFELPFPVELLDTPRVSGVRAPRNVVEAVADAPGVMPQRTAHGQGSPYIRGLTGFRTLLLVDGVRLNNAVFRDGPNQYANTVDNLSLGSVEVVRGPGSVQFGSDAMGGILNFIPLSVPEFEKGAVWGGRIYQRLASAERSSVSRLELSAVPDPEVGVLAGVSRKFFGDLRAGDGRLHRTGYDEWDADARILWVPDEDVRLTVGYQRVSQDDVPRTHKTVDSRSWHGTAVGNERSRALDQVRDLLLLRAEVGEPFSFMDRFTGTLSWHHHREVRRRVKGSGSSDRQGFDLDSFGATLQGESASSIGSLTYGIDAYRDRVSSFSKKYDAAGRLTGVGIQGPVGDDGTYDLAGVFLQDEIPLGTDFVLTAGARGTYAGVSAGSVQDPVTGGKISVRDRYSALVGSARLAYLGIEGLNLFGGVSQAFRAPNLSDLTRLDTARSNEIETPSPGLGAEHALSFELGARWSVDRDVASMRGELVLFHTVLDDLIQRFPTGDVIDGDAEVTKDNVGDGFAEGIEFGAEIELGAGFTAFGSGAWMVGKLDTYPTSASVREREYLDRLPPLSGRIGLRYLHESGLLVSGRVRMADKADRLSTRDRGDTQRIPPGGTPGYGVVDLSVSFPVTDFATMTLAGENLLDKAYRIHGSGQNEPGLNVSLTLELRF